MQICSKFGPRACRGVGRRHGLRRLAVGRASPLCETGEAARPRGFVRPRGAGRRLGGAARHPQFVASWRRALRRGRLRRRAHRAAEFCSVCFDPTDLAPSGLDRLSLDKSGTPLAISLAAFAPEFRGDPDPERLASIGPYPVAAPAPEISTAAMLTMGFATVVWSVRRRRPPPSMSRLKRCAC